MHRPDPLRGSRRKAPLVALLALGLLWASGAAQQTESERARKPDGPELHGVFYGDSMFTVLPLNAIRAIQSPGFVFGDMAAAQMAPEEPVIGIILGKQARAYSMWQLDAHEIVNDRLGDKSFAVTW